MVTPIAVSGRSVSRVCVENSIAKQQIAIGLITGVLRERGRRGARGIIITIARITRAFGYEAFDHVRRWRLVETRAATTRTHFHIKANINSVTDLPNCFAGSR